MTTNTTTTEPGPPVEAPPQTAKPPGKKKKRGFIWAFFLLITVGVTTYAVWRASQPGLIPQTNQGGKGGFGGKGGRGNFGGGPLPVVVATARSASVPVYFSGLGSVTPFYTVTVKSRVDGQLMKVNFQEGDLVKEGQVLAEIDPRPFQVMLEQAEGSLAHDQALLDNAKLDMARYETLLAQDAIPKQQLDTQKALVQQYNGNIQQDKGNIDNAKLQLTYAKIVAPITGKVGLRLVDPGNIVHAGDANGMVVITQVQPISVLFTIPEDNLPAVVKKLNAGAHLPVDAYNRDKSQKLTSGMLLTMDNQIDASTGMSRLKAIFDNKNFDLFPQQFVNINLLVDTMQNQVVVPTVAVQMGQQGNFVYVIDDNSVAHIRTVQVIEGVNKTTDGADIKDIKSGLQVGENVAVDGADRLQDGSKVRVRTQGEIEKAAAADAAAFAGRRKGGGSKGGGPKGQSGQPDGGGQPGQAPAGKGQGGGPGQGGQEGGGWKKGQGGWNKGQHDGQGQPGGPNGDHPWGKGKGGGGHGKRGTDQQ